MLSGQDAAVLWDIRVSPQCRGQRVGSALLRAVESWVIPKNACALVVETQNTNVPACRFYARHGFVLDHIVPFAYAAFPDEVQLLWRKELVLRPPERMA